MERETSEYQAYLFYQMIDQRLIENDQVLKGDLSITAELGGVMASLWSDRGVRNALDRAGSFCRIPESASYFLNHIERLSDASYVPSTQDIINARYIREKSNFVTRFSFSVDSKRPEFSR